MAIKNSKAEWEIKIDHRDAEKIKTDTIKIFTPKLITEIKYQNNRLINIIAFLSGIIAAAAVFIIAKI